MHNAIRIASAQQSLALEPKFIEPNLEPLSRCPPVRPVAGFDFWSGLDAFSKLLSSSRILALCSG